MSTDFERFRWPLRYLKPASRWPKHNCVSLIDFKHRLLILYLETAAGSPKLARSISSFGKGMCCNGSRTIEKVRDKASQTSMRKMTKLGTKGRKKERGTAEEGEVRVSRNQKNKKKDIVS